MGHPAFVGDQRGNPVSAAVQFRTDNVSYGPGAPALSQLNHTISIKPLFGLRSRNAYNLNMLADLKFAWRRL